MAQRGYSDIEEHCKRQIHLTTKSREQDSLLHYKRRQMSKYPKNRDMTTNLRAFFATPESPFPSNARFLSLMMTKLEAVV